MNGWIKLHRSLKSHWIDESNRPRTYREAWEDILLTVNWESKKVLVVNQLIDCEEGQSLNSLQSWAKLFNWTIAKVRHFFNLLEKDEIITLEGLQYTTRLTVCKWCIYQGEATDEKQTEQTAERITKNTPKTTTKEGKEIKNKKTINNSLSWREDFEIFKRELNEALESLSNNKDWLAQQQKFNPSLDLPLTLEKAVVNFWGTVAGWKNKKKTKTEVIDWKATLTNAISQPANKVYKQPNGMKLTTQGRPGQILQPDEARAAELLAKFEQKTATA